MKNCRNLFSTMIPKLIISSSVLERLRDVKSKNTGMLFGIVSKNSLTIVSFALNPSILDEDESSILPASLQLNMPVEIDLCGVIFLGESPDVIPEAFKDIDITDNPLLIKYSLDSHRVESFFYVHQALKPAGDPEIIPEAQIWERFFYIRLRTSIPLVTEKSDLIDAFQRTRKNLASGSVGFHFPRAGVFLLGTDSESRIIDVREFIDKSGSKSPGTLEVIDATMLVRMTSEKTSENSLKYAPVLQHIQRNFQSLQFDLNVDTLSVVGGCLGAGQLYSILVESVCRNLRLIERSFALQLNQEEELRIPEVFHFKPGSMHLISLAYPRGAQDEQTREYRRNLHRALSFNLSRPLFCRGNSVKFSSDFTKNEPIIRPHERVLITGDFLISSVKGNYAYHHYMQGDLDDSGWGCAYRSLQTIFSWFRLQGYTEQPVPSHRDIQKCLVEIGDKPHGFIGSKQWIGSTEVGFVLETLLGISVRVLCAATGERMDEQVESLREHFETQGTPVMIGGGVLAHTILGVAESEGDVRFLILDPHYTGAEDLSTIISKGWCGWKGMNFWKKDAFYNMCLPQRPVKF